MLSKASNMIVYAEYYKRSDGGKRIDFKRQATMMVAKTIDDWKRSLMSGTDPDNPRLGDWMRFRDNMKQDGHLMSCVENRILPVQCAPYKLVDDNGNEDLEAKKLLERPWYLDMVAIVCSQTFEGVKLVSMFELSENGELKQVEEVPQSNFIPQKGIILIDESDTDGISYRSGAYKNYYFQVGNDWNMGIFSQLAMVVLAKKLGLGSWMSYIDKYGVPPIFAITNRMDTKRRDELFEMLQTFRMNHFAVLQGDEKIETPQGYNVDAYNTFKSLMSDICDKEISKRILGSSGLTDEKSFVGAAQVQERIMAYRHKVDKLLWKYYFNTEVKPRLVKLSPVYAPLADLTFEYDESETLSVKELLAIVQGLAPYFEFDIDELVKITGLPITKVKQTLGLPTDGSDTGNEDGQKKKPDVTGLTPFRSRSRSNPQGATLVYAATWEKTYQELSDKIRNGDIDVGDLDHDMILKTYDRLNKAAQAGYGSGYYNDPIARKMRENLLRFAATKTHVQQQQVKTLSDSIREDQAYRDETKKYLNLQNGTYLDVQAAWASRSAQSGRQYQEFQQDKDIYPNLKFRTMKDDDVRPTHAVLEGMIISIDDPRLDEYMPPLDPRCRCWLEQTRAAVTDFDPDYHPDPQWSGNPGRNGVIFNDDNSYNQKVENNSTRLDIRCQAELAKEYLPYNRVIEVGENKVYVNDFADMADLEQNLVAAKKIVRELEQDVYIRHHIDGGLVPGHKNPELSISKKSTLGDLKTYQGDGRFGNFILNSLKSANTQGAKCVVLDVTHQKDYREILERKLAGGLNDRCHNIERVIVINGNKVSQITRKQIENRDFTSLDTLK